MDQIIGALFAIAFPALMAFGLYRLHHRMQKDIATKKTASASHKITKFIGFAILFAVIGFLVMMLAVGVMSGMANA